MANIMEQYGSNVTENEGSEPEEIMGPLKLLWCGWEAAKNNNIFYQGQEYIGLYGII